MSNTIVAGLQGNLQHAFSLLDAYIDACPDKIWGEKFGGWPVWQQYYHAFAVIPFFLRGPDEPEEVFPFAPLVGVLKETPDITPDKGTIKAFADKMRDRALAYASGLDDAALSRKNEGLSKRFGRDMTHAGTLALIGSHLQYHLGSCDAALRENGIPGVF
ncbi:MAG: DinB family protein [Desulfovibrio sp.]|nr:DinB family protein [Desulfovibrio sp.]